jgi:hypothetical protein
MTFIPEPHGRGCQARNFVRREQSWSQAPGPRDLEVLPIWEGDRDPLPGPRPATAQHQRVDVDGLSHRVRLPPVGRERG